MKTWKVYQEGGKWLVKGLVDEHGHNPATLSREDDIHTKEEMEEALFGLSESLNTQIDEDDQFDTPFGRIKP